MAEADTPTSPGTTAQLVRLQAKVCYMNVDRSLATWTRTSLALIVFGAVVDRFGLLLGHDHLPHLGTRLAPNPVSSVGGIILVALGVFIAASAAIRHQAYRSVWERTYGDHEPFGPWLAFGYAMFVVLAGAIVLATLLVFAA